MQSEGTPEELLKLIKKEPHDRGALDKEMMVNMILNAFRRPETLKECLQSVEK